jgi:hypothetical protein
MEHNDGKQKKTCNSSQPQVKCEKTPSKLFKPTNRKTSQKCSDYCDPRMIIRVKNITHNTTLMD